MTNLTRLCLPSLFALYTLLLTLPASSVWGQLTCDPAAEFSYDASAYCQNGPDPVVTHTTGTNGTYTYEVDSGGPFLALDPSTGAIDLSASDPGVYIVTNTVSSGGGPGPMVITGVVDGPLSGGTPKAVEFFVVTPIADLSEFGFSSANNGGGPTGAPEFVFPPVSVPAGTFIWVATETTNFNAYFGFDPTYVSNAASINGDDAIELFHNGEVIDVFGDVNVDGSGQPWEYTDGWAYRISNTGPDGSTFVIGNWTFSGPDALDGTTTNATAPNPWPIGTYTSGSTASCSRAIEIVAPPAADAGPNQLVCEGQPVQLSASGAGSWSGGAGTFSDINDPNATYTPAPSETGTTVVLTWTVPSASTGVCLNATDEVFITILPAPDAEFSYDASQYCPNGPNPVVSHTTGTDGIYTYQVLAGGPTLALDPQTGAIDLASSDKGTYEVTNTVGGCGNLVISGVIDGPVTGGLPKAVEFYALKDIPDLSIYGFGSANNGGGSDGEEFTFPPDAVSAGTHIWVATEAVVFENFFGFPPTYVNNIAPSINGDDAIELFCNGMVIDVFGEIDVDGSGQPWEYTDGWAYRVNDTGPDGAFFELSNWTFSGPDALDGAATNASSSNPFPIGTFASTAPGVCADDTHSVTITIDDTEAPQLFCPQDMVFTLSPGLCSKIVNFFISAVDNCDPNPNIEQTGGDLGSGDSFYIGTYELEFTATDLEGNTSTCQFSITILEFPNPTSTLTCNDMVQASLDVNGEALIGADMVLEGGPYRCYDNYLVEILNDNGEPLGNVLTCQDIGKVYTVRVTDPETGNKCWGKVVAEDKLPPVIQCFDRTISCTQSVEQVPAPIVVDNCDKIVDLKLIELVQLDNDACDDNQVKWRRSWIAFDDYNNASDTCTEIITIRRPLNVNFPNDITWQCEQYAAYPNIVDAKAVHPSIFDTKPSPPDTDNDIDVDPNLSINVLKNTGSGIPAGIDGDFCMYGYVFTDEILDVCNGASGVFKIRRTWTVLDWCTNQVITSGFDDENGNGIQDPGEETEDNIQLIKVVDEKPPVITVSDVTLNANVTGTHPDICRSTLTLPAPQVSDNCSGVADVKILTPIGEAVGGVIPAPGLPLGQHTIIVSAGDSCGNYTQKTFTLTVVDGIAPVAVCDEITDVNLSSDGVAEVFAETFDDGSYDNCCLSHFEVRKMVDDCDDGHDDTVFGPSVRFCCADVPNNPVTVVFRAWDCHGNYNDCMVLAYVNDKQKPVLVSCPEPQRITCDFYADNLETLLQGATTADEKSKLLDAFFGAPQFTDNCDLTIKRTFSANIDQCLEGTIMRMWQAVDAAGNASSNCSQTIHVDHVSDWVVEFPADLTVECGTTVPDFGEPEIFFETCELVAISYEDEVFTTVPDACYKILRTWTVINWCVVGQQIDEEVVEQPESQLGLPFPACDLDGDGDCDNRTFRDSWNAANMPTTADATKQTGPDTDPDSDPWDGYITYQQTIKVIDTVDPVFTFGCVIPEVVFNDGNCSATFELPQPFVDECSGLVTITAESDLGSGLGPFSNVPPGTYHVTYTAIDNCNNQTDCEATLVVKDGKKPTPYCKSAIAVNLMDADPEPMIEVWASDLDAGSFDNCTASSDLIFSFSEKTSETSFIFGCEHVGSVIANVWVTDEAGNQDYCQVFVVVQDNQNLCVGTPLVALGGHISNEVNTPVKDVEVLLSGTMNASTTTDAEGKFLFEHVEQGGDYTLLPVKDVNYLNGVTTFDLVLITRHILGTQLLDSPYKIIAADANKSGSVTTLDLVQLRKLILFIDDELPGNTSWRFVRKDFVFPNPANPFQTTFPELYNVNNLPADKLNADFVAIKVGDVNLSAVPSFKGGPQDRTYHGRWPVRIRNVQYQPGQDLLVPVYAGEVDVEGFQFTIYFDRESLDLLDVIPGTLQEEHLGKRLIDEGKLTVSWNTGFGKPLDEKQPLFGLKFRARKKGSLDSSVEVISRPTVAEAYRGTNLLLPELAFESDGAQALSLQVAPNPFHATTTVKFHCPTTGGALLRVTDLHGRIVKEWKLDSETGYGDVEIAHADLPAPGVYVCTLVSGNERVSKRIVLID